MKGYIKSLENELSAPKNSNNCVASVPTPESSTSSSRSYGYCQNASPSAHPATPYQRPQWEGIQVSTTRTDQPSYYGPASSFYLVRRIGGFLSKVLDQPYAEQKLHPWSRSTESRIAQIQSTEVVIDNAVSLGIVAEKSSHGMTDLSRVQEESLLRLFWEGYHCLLPVVDEMDFRSHYASLWQVSSKGRKDSPLVDIIIALCQQYSYAFTPHRRNASRPDISGPSDDAATAGRWHYRRAQSLLASSLENPSITTVQCYIFMMVYLCCASFHNMCHIMAAQAIRTAQVLGLHLEPPRDIPEPQRELRRRIWWSLWILDAKTSMKLCRPLAVDVAYTTVSIPSDGLEVAENSGTNLRPFSDGISWLSYITYQTRLYVVMLGIYDPLYLKFGESIHQHRLVCIYHDPQVLELCAVMLAEKLPCMRLWVESLPMALKCRRQNEGRPFSTDRAAFDIDDLAPTWLTRQRVCMELTYHHFMVLLTRPFITFYTPATTHTPLTERHATTCVEHAIKFSSLMHQVVTESDIFSGWTEYFSLLWNSSITMVGFLLAYPIHPATPRARQALDKAITVFDILGVNFGVSEDAAAITRDLISKADLVASRLGAGVDVTMQSTETDNAEQSANEEIPVGSSLSWLDPNQQYDAGQFNDLVDWALSVDSFNNFEKFFDFSDAGTG